MTEVAKGNRVPKDIVRTLRQVIGRTRLVIGVRGVGTVLACALGILLLVMGIDAAVVIFSANVRYGLTICALVLTVAALVWFLVRPLARSMTLDGVARAVESHHPEIQERISSAVELMSSTDSPDVRGSTSLIEALVKAAREDIRTIRPRREITFRAARPALAVAGGLLAVMLLLYAAWPDGTQRLLLRAVAPHLNLPNVRADDLTVVPGDTVVTRGAVPRIDVDVANAAVRSAEVRVLRPDGDDEVAEMARVFDPSSRVPRFTFTCPPAERSFRYRVHAGDALSRYYTVQVVPFPAVAGIDVRYDYPAYTGLPHDEYLDAPCSISAVAGTNVTITVRTNTTVDHAALLLDGLPYDDAGGDVEPAGDGTSNCVYRLCLAPGTNGRWRPQFSDAFGFDNESDEMEIRALPDDAPEAAIVRPQNDGLRLAPDDRLPVEYAIGDDFGLSGARLALKTDRGELPTIDLPVADGVGDAGAVVSDTKVVDLRTLDLRGARRLTLQVEAADTLPAPDGGPQVTRSNSVTIELDIKADRYAEQVLQSWEEEIRAGLEAILAELKSARERSGEAAPAIAARGPLAKDAHGKLDGALKHLDAADSKTRDLAQRVAWSAYAGYTPRLNSVADQHIAVAENQTVQVKLTDETDVRTELADDADLEMHLAIVAVEDMLRELNVLADLARDQLELADLAEREDGLAETRRSLDEAALAERESSMTDEEWQRLQRELAAQLDEAVREAMREAAAGTRMRDLAAEARELSEEQERLRRATERLDRVMDQDARLQKLMDEQNALAAEAASFRPSGDQEGIMRQAADDIQTDHLPAAVLKQTEAARVLGDRARQRRELLQSQAVAQGASRLAEQQRELAEQDPQAPGYMQRQQAVAEGMQALQQLARQSGWETDQTFRRNDPVGQMNEAVQALQNGNPEKAEQAADDAATRAEAMAQDLRARASRIDDDPSRQEDADRLADLAGRQNDLRARTEDAMRRLGSEGDQLDRDQMERLMREQNEVASEAAQLLQRTPDAPPQQRATQLEAARAANRAARRLEEHRLPEATDSAQQAARALADLAEHAAEPAAETAQRLDEKDVGQLARRQERLANEMAMLAEGHRTELAHSRQEGIHERTAGIRQEAGQVRDMVEAFAPEDQAMTAANRAAEQLQQAETAQAEAARQIASGQPEAAMPQQRASSSALAQAARELDNLGRRLDEVAARDRHAALAAAQAHEAGSLAEAADAADHAASDLDAEAAQHAADLLRSELDAAQALARSLGLRADIASMPHAMRAAFPSLTPQRRAAGAPDMRNPRTAQLRDLGITLDDWAKLPGHLRSDILQAAGDEVPPEYRSLVRRYFRAMARRGGMTAPEGEQ